MIVHVTEHDDVIDLCLRQELSRLKTGIFSVISRLSLKLGLRDCTTCNFEIVDHTNRRCRADESVLMKAIFTYREIFTQARAARKPELLFAVATRLSDIINFDDLTKEQMRSARPRPMNLLDLTWDFGKLNPKEHQKRYSALEQWSEQFGSPLKL